MIESAALIIGAYLIGSIPTGYLIGRFAAGIDIREYGSGNVGSSNVIAHVGLKTGVLQGLFFDGIVKGAVPVLVAKYALGLDVWAQGAAGLAAIAGHNWSPYLGFTGGRGVATALAATLALGMWMELAVMATVSAVGGIILSRDTGLWTFISILAFPILAVLFQKPPEMVIIALIVGIVMLSKRLTSNWERPPPEYGFRKTMAYRLIWDRDVPKRVEWTERRPD